MALRINRVRAVAANDAGFSDLLAALPDGVGPCLCCRRCSAAYPADQLLADWVERLGMRYGGTDVPDYRFERG